MEPDHNPPDEERSGLFGVSGSHPTRLAVGLGDPDLEQTLLPALSASGDFIVVERCLGADQLLACVVAKRVDAALVSARLHRLTDTLLADLAGRATPFLLLADESDVRWLPDLSASRGAVIPPSTPAQLICDALRAVVRGDSYASTVPVAVAEPVEVEDDGIRAEQDDQLSVIAVVGGHGSPGRTTVALNLAAALGAVAPTVLVDADLEGPSVAAYLDADPTRNIFMLAHAEPATPNEWERAIRQETQSFSQRVPHAVALCGIPKSEMRTGVSARFMRELIPALQQRFRYVVLDLGAELLATDAATARAALGQAPQLLLVASADMLGLWRARAALTVIKEHLGVDQERIALVINRHDRKHHYGRNEIEWALGTPAAAVIPWDYKGMQKGLAEQRPVVLVGRSRAAHALLDLAERIHGGSILLPPEPTARPNWLKRGITRLRAWPSHLHWPHRERSERRDKQRPIPTR